MSERTTLYSILGLPSTTCAPAEVRKAYLRRARETHPDKVGDGGSEAAFREVTDAYAVLADDERRKKYDRTLADRRTLDTSTSKTSSATRHPDLRWSRPTSSYFDSHSSSAQQFGSSDESSSSSASSDSASDTEPLFHQRSSRWSSGREREYSDTSADDFSPRYRHSEPDAKRQWTPTESVQREDHMKASFASLQLGPTPLLAASPPPINARRQSAPHITCSFRYREPSPPPPALRKSSPPSSFDGLDWLEQVERTRLADYQAERRSRSRASSSQHSRRPSPDWHARGPSLRSPLYPRSPPAEYPPHSPSFAQPLTDGHHALPPPLPAHFRPTLPPLKQRAALRVVPPCAYPHPFRSPPLARPVLSCSPKSLAGPPSPTFTPPPYGPRFSGPPPVLPPRVRSPQPWAESWEKGGTVRGKSNCR